MAVPKQKTSKSRKRKRRSHLALSAPALSRCARCGATLRPHTVCEACGHYGGKRVFPEADQDR